MMKNDLGIWVPDVPTIFIKPTEQIISQRKLEGLHKLAEIKQWGLRNPTKFMERFIGVELLDVQNYTFMSSWNKMYALWLCTRNYGKALALDTPIPTPNGYKQMGELQIGEYVYDKMKNPTRVVNTSPIFNDHRCYEVILTDDEIIADEDHLWQVSLYDESVFIGDYVLTTKEMFLKQQYYDIYVPLSSSYGLKRILAIVETESVPTKCISVDNKEKLYLCGKNYTVTHNSTLLALYYMTRGLLLNNCRCYICAGTSDQSIETFEKIVAIAKNEIESFTGLTDVFRNEVVINMSNNDGFIRNPAGFTYRLYNGSFVKTLNSNINAKRGLALY